MVVLRSLGFQVKSRLGGGVAVLRRLRLTESSPNDTENSSLKKMETGNDARDKGKVWKDFPT